MGFWSRFKKRKKNQSWASAVAIANINDVKQAETDDDVLEDDKGVAYTKNNKGVWVKDQNQTSTLDHNHNSQYLGLTAKAADANKLDGLDSSQFLRSDANDTLHGNLTVTGDVTVSGGDIYVGKNGGSDEAIHFYDDNSNTWRTLRWDDSANGFVVEDNGGTIRVLVHDGNVSSKIQQEFATRITVNGSTLNITTT